MAERRSLLYYITDRSHFSGGQFSGDEGVRRRALLDKIAEAACAGVDYIQLREKDLSTRALEQLAYEAVSLIRGIRTEDPELKTRLLINSRTDVALAVEADGVHLRSDDVSVADVRLAVGQADRSRQSGGAAWGARRGTIQNQSFSATPEVASFLSSVNESNSQFLIGISCHKVADIRRAESQGADFVVFAPMFEKKNAPGTDPQGLAALREACLANIPVLALGGVTLENASACLEAGAAGIAGIRLFQENKISDVVRALRPFQASF